MSNVIQLKRGHHPSAGKKETPAPTKREQALLHRLHAAEERIEELQNLNSELISRAQMACDVLSPDFLDLSRSEALNRSALARSIAVSSASTNG
jgi:hypothetical protein